MAADRARGRHVQGERLRRKGATGGAGARRFAGMVPLVVACLVSLWYPLDSDQALFHLGARDLADGAVYYRDFWDIKQPGIYWFYQAGYLLGLGDLGARLLEIVLVLAVGMLVPGIARDRGLSPWLVALSPSLVLGPYVLLSHLVGVGQVEGLTTPLVVALVAACRPQAPDAGVRSPWRWLGAGVCAGLIGVLKLLYLPIALVLLAGVLLESRRHGARALVPPALAAVAGVALPLLAAIGYFAAHGALRLAVYTTFTVPPQVAALETLHPPGAESQYVPTTVGLLALWAVPMIVTLVTAPARGAKLREGTLLVAAVLAAAVAVPQVPAAYRPLVVAGPLALLALPGLEVLRRAAGRLLAASPERTASRRRLPRPLALAGVAALVLASVAPTLRGPVRLATWAPSVTSWSLADDAVHARDGLITGSQVPEIAAPVEGSIPAGAPIYVFGDPRIYTHLRARQAVPVHGWAVEMLPATVIDELARQLAVARPVLVYVGSGSAEIIRATSPELTGLLSAGYRVTARTGDGTWYRTDRPGTGARPDVATRLPAQLP